MTEKPYIRRIHDLDADKAKLKIQGFNGVANVNAITNIDFKLPEDRWISGGILIAQGTHWGDKICLQIIDKDNILGAGVNYVIDEYVTDFYLITDSEFQIQMDAPYIALIPKDIYVRVVYTNISLLDPVEVAFNLVSHIPRV